MRTHHTSPCGHVWAHRWSSGTCYHLEEPDWCQSWVIIGMLDAATASASACTSDLRIRPVPIRAASWPQAGSSSCRASQFAAIVVQITLLICVRGMAVAKTGWFQMERSTRGGMRPRGVALRSRPMAVLLPTSCTGEVAVSQNAAAVFPPVCFRLQYGLGGGAFWGGSIGSAVRDPHCRTCHPQQRRGTQSTQSTAKAQRCTEANAWSEIRVLYAAPTRRRV
eukprot:890287-Prymnesium_polylepis.1